LRPRSFAELPAEVERLLADHARVVLVYFDAFGWRFAERHSDHPLLAQARVERWTSQFPSTTTVHTTTIHTGLPVADHGLYEWHCYEPRLNRLITPLWFCFAGENTRDTLLAAGVEPRDVFPFEPLYRRLPVPSHVAMPGGIAGSLPSRRLLGGATVHRFRDAAEGLARLAAAVAAEERAYGLAYLPEADARMHAVGPDAPEVAAAIDRTLSALRASRWPAGTLVLLTSDHGMAAISPERTTYLNVVWPELGGHLAAGADGRPLAPAGSARDLFLHVLPERLDEVAARLAALLEGKAAVRRVDDLLAEGLFGRAPSDALRARLANLVVLPGAGEAVWWLDPPRFEQRFRGQHGGLSADEMEIPLASWVA